MKSSRKIGTVPDYPAEIGGVPAATRGIQLCLIAVFALALTSCAPQKAPQNS